MAEAAVNIADSYEDEENSPKAYEWVETAHKYMSDPTDTYCGVQQQNTCLAGSYKQLCETGFLVQHLAMDFGGIRIQPSFPGLGNNSGDPADLAKIIADCVKMRQTFALWQQAHQNMVDAIRDTEASALSDQSPPNKAMWLGKAFGDQALALIKLAATRGQDRQARYAEAKAIVEENLPQMPDSPALNAAHGFVLLEEGKIPEARAAFLLAITQGLHVRAAWGLMRSYIDTEAPNLPEAVRLFEAIKKPDATAWYDFGRIYYLQGKYAEAYTIWSQLLRRPFQGP